MSKKVLIASDHAGFRLKSLIQKALPDWEWIDLGPPNADRVDYPDYAEKLGKKMNEGVAPQGILICGSGIGMCISANKIRGIRAAVVENPISAQLSREHNDANVLCLGSRFVAAEYGAEIAENWLKTKFSGDGRHKVRVAKIAAIEAEYGGGKTSHAAKPGHPAKNAASSKVSVKAAAAKVSSGEK